MAQGPELVVMNGEVGSPSTCAVASRGDCGDRSWPSGGKGGGPAVGRGLGRMGGRGERPMEEDGVRECPMGREMEWSARGSGDYPMGGRNAGMDTSDGARATECCNCRAVEGLTQKSAYACAMTGEAGGGMAAQTGPPPTSFWPAACALGRIEIAYTSVETTSPGPLRQCRPGMLPQCNGEPAMVQGRPYMLQDSQRRLPQCDHAPSVVQCDHGIGMARCDYSPGVTIGCPGSCRRCHQCGIPVGNGAVVGSENIHDGAPVAHDGTAECAISIPPRLQDGAQTVDPGSEKGMETWRQLEWRSPFHPGVPALPSESSPPPPRDPLSRPRLISLDILRSITIVLMILVNNQPCGGRHSWPFMRHASWLGMTVADAVFPAFLFIMGMAIPISLMASHWRVGKEPAGQGQSNNTGGTTSRGSGAAPLNSGPNSGDNRRDVEVGGVTCETKAKMIDGSGRAKSWASSDVLRFTGQFGSTGAISEVAKQAGTSPWTEGTGEGESLDDAVGGNGLVACSGATVAYGEGTEMEDVDGRAAGGGDSGGKGARAGEFGRKVARAGNVDGNSSQAKESVEGTGGQPLGGNVNCGPARSRLVLLNGGYWLEGTKLRQAREVVPVTVRVDTNQQDQQWRSVCMAVRTILQRHQLMRVLRRGLLLFLLGLLLGPPVKATSFLDGLVTWRVMGVLQRLGICYVGCALGYLYLPRTSFLLCFPTALLTTYMLLTYSPLFLPLAGCEEERATAASGPSRWQIPVRPECTAEAFVDLAILGRRIYQGGILDPEGIPSTLTAMLSTFFGVLMGIDFVRWRDTVFSTTAAASAGKAVAGAGPTGTRGVAFGPASPPRIPCGMTTVREDCRRGGTVHFARAVPFGGERGPESYLSAKYRKLADWSFAAGIFLCLGYLSAQYIPLSKKLWTPSFVLVSTGTSITAFCLIAYVVDLRMEAGKGAWSWFGHLCWDALVAFGRNPLILYILSEVFFVVLKVIPAPAQFQSSDVHAMYDAVYAFLFATWIPWPGMASLLTPLSFTCLVLFPLAWFMDKRRWYVRL